ncbi:MAG: murein transglycosylase domain-containing protein [Campylobacterota bacterium]|nr:murein transglycosylase domain-containing protein [Campylobacterota bacterium]
MLKELLLITSLTTATFALTMQEYAEQQKQAFSGYKKTQEEGFKAYRAEQLKAFNDYKKEIGAIWDEPKMSTKKTWVAYTPDKKTRTDVDFDNETIVVETVASSPKEAKEKLQVALAKVVTVDTKTVQKTDPLEKILAKIQKPEGVVDAKVKAEPILATVVFKKPPTKESVKTYINQNITAKNIEVKKSKVKFSKIYKVKVKMPSNATQKRSKIYYSEVKKQAKRQDIPMPLVFAIMHSESSFNPRAKSHIPAYGLMQIVPKSAGIDTYRYLYKEKKLVTGSYLYDSTNNITMGSGYLHILYYRYLKAIKNPESRMYCTIAAYNTGAGNIAFAFNRYKTDLSRKEKFRMKYAKDEINSLTPQQVYARLMKDLKWDEPKHYLKKVSKRMSVYHKIYGL